MSVFFIADMHFGSASNAKWRKFQTPIEMDAAISKAWRERVRNSDTVWVLGDVGSLDSRGLPGKKHLIFGNDDKPKGVFKDSGIFASHANSRVHEFDHGAVLLIHNPKEAPNDGLPVVHGHTHSKPDESDPRFVSVSVDKTDWGPISLDQVTQRLAARRNGEQ